MRRLAIVLGTLCLLGSGCRPYKLKAPAGFAEVTRHSGALKMIGGNHVGLNLRVYDNVKGGSLGFWGQDLATKLAARGYVLQSQAPAKSKNGVSGTRYDFAYQNPEGAKKFYSAVLFVSNKRRIVLQLAGDAEHAAAYLPRLDKIAASTTIKGCSLVDNNCHGAQPPSFVGAVVPSTPNAAPATDKLAQGDEATPEPEQTPPKTVPAQPKATR